jgi:hypothetical protein
MFNLVIMKSKSTHSLFLFLVFLSFLVSFCYFFNFIFYSLTSFLCIFLSQILFDITRFFIYFGRFISDIKGKKFHCYIVLAMLFCCSHVYDGLFIYSESVVPLVLKNSFTKFLFLNYFILLQSV